MPYEKVGKNEPVCIAGEVPFEIPNSWEWVRFCNLVSFNIGKTPPRKEDVYWCSAQYPWVSIADMNADSTIVSTKEYVSQYAYDNTFKGKIVPKDTLLMSFKLTVGKVSLLEIDAFHNEAIISIYPIVDINNIVRNYLFFTLPLLSQLGETKTAIKGNTLNSESLNNLLIPLPPIKEQHRIVSRINELLPSIEKYNKLETELNALQDNSPDQLKKSILQEAIQGKLVPQDPTDEPASILLERIRAEKQRLIEEGKIKKDKHESIIFRRDNSYYEKLDGVERCIDDELPFEIPENWCWVRFGTALVNRDAERIPLSVAQREKLQKKYDYYGASGVIDKVDQYLFDKPLLLIGEDGANLLLRSKPIAFIASGQYWVNNHAHVIDSVGGVDLRFIALFINAINLAPYVTGTAQPKMNQEKLNSILVPLPPVAEQHRIVIAFEEIVVIIR